MDASAEGPDPSTPAPGDAVSPSERERTRFGPGIYIHFPFCVQRCGYCDFFVVLAGDDARESYVQELLSEIDLAADASGPDVPGFSEVTFETIFLGGGTPSLLTPRQLQSILDRLRRRFRFQSEVEITVECNPESATRDRLAGYQALGVNRVSFGVQSLDREELRLLDRAHGVADAGRRMDDARRVGIPSVSLDLIYGLPGTGSSHPGLSGDDGETPGAQDAGESPGDRPPREEEMRWLRTLESALALGPDHLSSYLLTLEPHVPLARRLRRGDVAPLPGDDDAAEQYEVLRTRAAANGLLQYEISNFARSGEASRHNQNYWTCGDYLGLGPSAHSHRQGTRWSNVRSLGGYREALARGRRPIDSRERLEPQQRAEEWVFLGLRRLEGLPVSIFTEWWGEGAWDRLRSSSLLSSWLEFDEPLALGENRIRLSTEGLFVSNSVFAEVCDVLGPVRGRALGR